MQNTRIKDSNKFEPNPLFGPVTNLVGEVFNNFEVGNEEKTRRAKARKINSGYCYDFAYQVLKRMEKVESMEDLYVNSLLPVTKVVILQHVHCFLIIDNVIYDAEDITGVPIHGRATIEMYLGKWMYDHNDEEWPIKIVQYEVIREVHTFEDGGMVQYDKLEPTGVESFLIPGADHSEQEEVVMSAKQFIEIYELDIGDFQDCAFWPYTPEQIRKENIYEHILIKTW